MKTYLKNRSSTFNSEKKLQTKQSNLSIFITIKFKLFLNFEVSNISNIFN